MDLKPSKSGELKEWEERFWLYWGESPKGTPKYKAGLKALAFAEKERNAVLQEIEEKMPFTPHEFVAWEKTCSRCGINKEEAKFNYCEFERQKLQSLRERHQEKNTP